MRTYKGLTKKELVKILAIETVKSIKKDMESKGQKWDYGNGFQSRNTIISEWEKLYNKYPIKSNSSPLFSLSRLYDEMIENKQIGGKKMKNEDLINILKADSLSLYTTVNDNIENITKEQLKDIILSLYLQIPNYISSPTILKHFYNDLVVDLETSWKNSEK